jgi:hypothetical protein
MDDSPVQFMQHRLHHTIKARPLPPMSERHDIFFPEYVLLLIIYEQRNVRWVFGMRLTLGL